MATKVSFVGLGAIGLPMARRLSHSDLIELTIFDVRSEILVEEKSLGRVAGSMKDAVSGADVISVLPADSHVTEVSAQVKQHGHKGQLYIDFSTVAPSTMETAAHELSERGLKVLSGTLMRSVAAAQEGTLSIFVGGDEDAVNGLMPILELMASDIRVVPSIGAAKALKIVNNMIVSAIDIAICDALVVATRFGCEPQDIIKRVKQVGGNSWPLANHIEKHLLGDDLEPGRFSARYMLKDAGLAVTLSTDRNEPAWFAGLSSSAYRGVAALGFGEYYNPVVMRWFEHIASVSEREHAVGQAQSTRIVEEISDAIVAMQSLITLDGLRIVSRQGIGLSEAIEHLFSGSASNDTLGALNLRSPSHEENLTLGRLLDALVKGCALAQEAEVPGLVLELSRNVALSLVSAYGMSANLSEVASRLDSRGQDLA